MEQQTVRTPYSRRGNFHPVPGLKPPLPSSQAAILNAQQVSNLRADICHPAATATLGIAGYETAPPAALSGRWR